METLPAVIASEAGAMSNVLPVDSATLAPPLGATFVKFTLQVVEVFGLRLVALHDKLEIKTATTKFTEAVAELLPYVAVMVTVWSAANVVVVALKLNDVAPFPTLADGGTVSIVLLLFNDTDIPPLEAALLSAPVHVVEAFCPRVVGIQDSDDTRTGAIRLKVAVTELAPTVAVSVTV